MLSASESFKTILKSQSRKYHFRMTLARNTGDTTPIDITSYVTSYNLNQDFEARGGVLDFEIDNYDWSLSPLNRESPHNLIDNLYEPLIDSNHEVVLYEGLELSDGSVEFVKKFVGYMGDDITIESDSTISISCRDKSKLLQDAYIYESPSYKLFLVEDVIQDLLNTFVPSLKIKVTVANKTQYMIGRPDSPYAAKDTNLWDAITLLADTASHEIRFMEDGTLLMRKIERSFAQDLPVLKLDLSVLIGNTSTISDADVRNEIVVKVQNYTPIVKKDERSIAKYGRRYMEVQKGVSDIITDISQAHELAEGILRDLRFAKTNDTAEIPLHPLVQVGDIVWLTNERIGSNPTSMRYKVVSVDNNYSATQKRTSLGLEGYDKYTTETGYATKAPTGLSNAMQSRVVMNYTGSNWIGKKKTSYFPMIKWVKPTVYNVTNAPVEDDFGGYVIYRRVKDAVKLTWSEWASIASIPSYISSLVKHVDYFYDYSSMNIIDLYKKNAKVTSVSFEYRIVAVTTRGARSANSSVLAVNVSVPKIEV